MNYTDYETQKRLIKQRQEQLRKESENARRARQQKTGSRRTHHPALA